MPLLRNTQKAINKKLSSFQDPIIKAKEAFNILVESYQAQRFSRKKSLSRLLHTQRNLKDLSSFLDLFLEMKTLHMTLLLSKSSFALRGVLTILDFLKSVDLLNKPEQASTLFSPEQTEKVAPAYWKWRTKILQKKYGIKHLSHEELTSYTAFFIGNDPNIKGLEKHKQPTKDTETIAIVGTSVLRSIEIALTLGNGFINPKVVIIDNSYEVITLWKNLRQLLLLTNTREDFFTILPKFLMEQDSLYRDLSGYFLSANHPTQNISQYFLKLFGKFGFEPVRKVMCGTTIIKQSWENEEIFTKLQAVFHVLNITKIHVYASNIIACTDYNKESILKNIHILQPKLSIHTTHTSKCYPTELHLLENSNPEHVYDQVVSANNHVPPLGSVHHRSRSSQFSSSSFQPAFFKPIFSNTRDRDNQHAFSIN